MTPELARRITVQAVQDGCNVPAYAAEEQVLISAAQIIRSCTIDELLCISTTTADAGDLWGAKALADFEIKRREANAHGFIRGRRSAGTLSDSEGAPSDS